jgi:hypothetical protein
MAEARAAQMERMTQEKAILLAFARGEVDKVYRVVSFLEGELVSMHQAQDASEEKLRSLVDKAAIADQRQVAVEEQCEHLVNECTLLHLRGSELCMTITDTPPQIPLYEEMRFVAAHHTKVAMWLSVLWQAVSLAAHSVLGRLHIDVY